MSSLETKSIKQKVIGGQTQPLYFGGVESDNSDAKFVITASGVPSFEETMVFALSDETTAITTGTAKLTFRMPFAVELTKIPRASLSTASSSGNPAIDINKNGTSIFSTTLTIDANEKTSTTAATAAVLSSSSIADDDELTFDIDTAGTGAKGLKITLYYKRV